MDDLDARIVIHHVGGRGGSVSAPFRLPRAFQDSLVVVLYDADPDCLEHMGESAGMELAETRVYPYFLGRQAGRGVLNINYDPYTSSTGDLNPRYAGFYSPVGDVDYIIGDALQPVETREIDITTLDELVTSGDHSIPPPDFLSLDVCGMGHDIYLGGRETLGAEVLGVVDNMSFHPVRRGQKLLPDHCRFLEELGFDFVGFGPHNDYSPYRAPIGQRAKGYMLAADTVFLRQIETLETVFPDHDRRYLKCCKLAFVTLCLGYVELALALIDMARRLEPKGDVRARVAATSYGRFLDKLGRAADAMPRRFPPKFVERYTVEQSRDRFRASRDVTHSGLKGRLKAWLLGHPRLIGAVRFVRRDRGISRKARTFLNAVIAAIPPRYSPFERILADHGLVDVAELVRRKRLPYH